MLTCAWVGGLEFFELLTNAYVGGGLGGYGRIPCLRNMWMTPYALASKGLTFGVQLVPLTHQSSKTQFTQLPCGRLSLLLVFC